MVTNRQRPFRVIAHRGASADAPENTAAAFSRAVALGVDEVELDVRRTSDGCLVLFHDAALRPKVDADGRAEDHPLNVLETLDIGAWFNRQTRTAGTDRGPGPKAARPVPTGTEPLMGFEAYLHRFGEAFIHNVELKGADADLPDLTLAALREHGILHRAILTSFSRAHVERTRTLAPDVVTGWLCGRPRDGPVDPADLIAVCQQLETAYFCPHVRLTSADVVEAAGAVGLPVRVWGVRSASDLRRALTAGAEGATVDWVAQARDIVNEAEAARQ